MEVYEAGQGDAMELELAAPAEEADAGWFISQKEASAAPDRGWFSGKHRILDSSGQAGWFVSRKEALESPNAGWFEAKDSTRTDQGWFASRQDKQAGEVPVATVTDVSEVGPIDDEESSDGEPTLEPIKVVIVGDGAIGKVSCSAWRVTELWWLQSCLLDTMTGACAVDWDDPTCELSE